MKHAHLTLIAIIYCISSFAQGQYMKYNNTTYKWQPDSTINLKMEIEQLFKNAPLIFEAKFVDSGEFIDTTIDYSGEESGLVYYFSTIQITKVIRSDKLKKGTIVVLDPTAQSTIVYNRNYGRLEMPISDVGQGISIYNTGIYFCDFSTSTPRKQSYPSYMVSNDNSSVVKFTNTNIAIDLTSYEFLFGSKKIKFKSKEEIYQFIEKYGNVTIARDTEKTEEPSQLKQTPEQKIEADSIKQAQNKILYEQKKKNYDQYMEQRMKMMDEKQKKTDTTKQTKPK